MATEALVTGQTAEGHVEEVKLTNDVKDIDKESCPESKDLDGKDDEEIKVEDSTGAAPATESETAVVSEEKQEDNKSEPAVEEVKNEDAEVEMASDPLNGVAVENEESSKEEVDPSTTEPKGEAYSAAVEPAVEADSKEPKSQVVVTDTSEPPQPSTETSTEISEATLVQELESETAKEPAVVEAAAEEVNVIPEAAAEEVNVTPEAAAEEADTTTEPKEEADSAAVEPEVEADGRELKSQVEVTDTSEPPQPSTETSTEASEASLVQELESETAKELAVPEVVAEEVNATPEAAAKEANTTTEPKEEAVSVAVEPAVEAHGKELKSPVEVTDTSEPLQPSTETSTETSEASLVRELESETAKEPAVPEASAKEANATTEEAAEEANTTTEASPVEVNTTEELPHLSSVSVAESKEAEPPVVSPVTEPAPDDIISDIAETSKGETIKLEENKESEKEEPLITDSSKLEVSDSVPEAVVSESADAVVVEAAPVKELIEEGKKAAVTEEVSNVPQLAEGDQNASASADESVSLDANPVSETVESFVKPDVKVEEIQEKAVVAEVPSETTKINSVPEIPSEGSSGVEKVEVEGATMEGSIVSLKDPDAAVEVPQVSSKGEKAPEGDEEKEDESLEDEKPTLVETSRGIDVEEGKNNVNTEDDSLVSDKTEKDDEKTPAESAKDAGEAPKADVPTKSSQRQSNSIFSKVKQSIVKVKKAIIGKSPSSKTVSAEGKEEVKVE